MKALKWLALAALIGTTGCAAIGEFFGDLGRAAEEAGEEIEDEIDDATQLDEPNDRLDVRIG